ncbi:MAG: hypothetical protein A2V66_01675 [Ignavibacteria bacterium RBG_13_36_8]|nr:MAG: hypothetical protein A2V66_01675 [Ignavibacteria bacterium RBG_13_36_8]
MNKDIYNDKKYKKIIKALKELPHINAPYNFEYYLITKIQNKNFGDLTKKKSYNMFWRLSPVAAAVVSAVILFFVFGDQSSEIENPLMKLPPAISESEVIATDNLGTIESPREMPVERSETAQSHTETSASRIAASEDEELFRVVVRSNDVISKEKIELSLSSANNVDLDSYINGGERTTDRNRRSRLVGGTESFEFDGFYIREQTDPRILGMIKNRIDSLMRMQADSLRRLKNMRK